MIHTFSGLIAFFGGHIKSVLIDGSIVPEVVIFVWVESVVVNRNFFNTRDIVIIVNHVFETPIRLTAQISHAVTIMLVEALAHIWNHCPIQMGCAHAAKLLEALELEDDGHKLKRRIDALCWANICLARIESIGKEVVKRNREAVVHTNRIAVKIVDIDLVVDMVCLCHRRHKIFQRVLAIENATGFAYTTAKAMLINIGVLVLDVSRFQFLGNRVHELCILATSHTMQIAILHIRLGNVLVFARHELSHHCVLNLLDSQTIMRGYLVCNTMGARLHLVCQTIGIYLDKCLADCLYNLVGIKFNLAPITLCNFQLLLPP